MLVTWSARCSRLPLAPRNPSCDVITSAKKRNCGLMVWDVFSDHTKIVLNFVVGSLGADQLTEGLEDHLIPFLNLIGRYYLIFQQDNAPDHNGNATKEWLVEQEVSIMYWPAR